MELHEIIRDKINNIGSLCLFINKRKDLLDEINNKIQIDISLVQKIWCYINGIENIYCDCGKIKKWKSFKDGWRITCGDKNCIINHRKNTNIKIYGVENPMKNEKIKNKAIETNIKKYGFNSPTKNDNIKLKISKSLKNRSVEDKKLTTLKLKETWNKKTNDEIDIIKNKIKYTKDNKNEIEKENTKNKRKITCLNRYGNEYAISSSEVREKILKIFNDKYGGNSPYSDKELRRKSSDKYKESHINYIKNNIKKHQCEYISHLNKGINGCNIEYTLKCLRKNKNFTIGYSSLRLKIIKNLEISPFFRDNYGTSEMEKDLFDYIENNYKGEILKNKKNIISPLELDIYLPELNLAFEFNGLYWHNELNKDIYYHLNKTEECEKIGIHLIHIYEDDWLYKQNIVKSRILNLLGLSEKIYARKCEIREINDNELIRNFLNKNHLQGFIGSKIKIGLFHNNELISLMIFGKFRVPLGQKSKENSYELLRFCNKLNTNVIGGASKLFKYFIKNYNPVEITSYADRSWSVGNLYEKLEFEFDHKTRPNYYYVIDGIRKHRFGFRKDKLIEMGEDKNKTEHQIMLEKNIFRIYDSGNLKFSFKI